MFKFAISLFSLVVWVYSVNASALPIQAKIEELTINGNLVDSTDQSKTFFLILHGTFASHEMEIISSLQSLLEEQGFGSLAITLSLGINDRKGFLDCEKTIVANHADAENELSLWFAKVKRLGYKKIALIGHSRGGSQVANFAITSTQMISKVFLIAPMVWEEEQVHSSYRSPLNLTLESILENLQQNSHKILKNHDVLHCKKTNVTAQSFLSYYDSFPEKDTPSLLKKLKLPVKVFLGDSDPLTKKFLARKNDYKENAFLSIKIIEDSDHFFRDFAIEDVVTDILQEAN